MSCVSDVNENSNNHDVVEVHRDNNLNNNNNTNDDTNTKNHINENSNQINNNDHQISATFKKRKRKMQQNLNINEIGQNNKNENIENNEIDSTTINDNTNNDNLQNNEEEPITTKRKFDQTNNEKNGIPLKEEIRFKKRQKLLDNKIENKLLFASNSNQKVHFSSHEENEFSHSNKSELSILPSGKEDQGATVEVTNPNDKTPKQSKIEMKSKTTSEGLERYRGLKNYEDPSKSNLKNPAPKFLGIGPQRAPDNVKITCRFDYQPDICKDWKETGYCGYGMSCKFLHDRSDYKFGWQLDRDYKKKEEIKNLQLQRKNVEIENDNYEIHDSDNDSNDDNHHNGNDAKLPFACYLCRQSFKSPVVTNCHHYFCEQCALNQFRKTPSCAICGENTQGQFHTAEKLLKAIKLKKN